MVLVLLLAALVAHAQGEPVLVSFAPESAQVTVGETVSVAVNVADVPELYGFTVALTFDPGVLQVQDSDPVLAGVQVGFGTFLQPGAVIVNHVDNENGFVEFAMTQLNPSPPQSGSGSLIVLSLLGETAGSVSPLEIVFVQLAAPRGIEIPSSGSSGSVEVLAEPLPGPTSTPIPTQPAGTTLPSATPPVAATNAPTSTPQPTEAAPSATATLAAGSTASPPALTATTAPATLPAQTGAPSPSPAGQASATPAEQVVDSTATGESTVPAETAAMDSSTPGAAATGEAIAGAADSGATEAAADSGEQADASSAQSDASVIGEGVDTESSSVAEERESQAGVPWAVILLAAAGVALVVAAVAFILRRQRPGE